MFNTLHSPHSCLAVSPEKICKQISLLVPMVSSAKRFASNPLNFQTPCIAQEALFGRIAAKEPVQIGDLRKKLR